MGPFYFPEKAFIIKLKAAMVIYLHLFIAGDESFDFFDFQIIEIGNMNANRLNFLEAITPRITVIFTFELHEKLTETLVMKFIHNKFLLG